jgi:hypothetical protein
MWPVFPTVETVGLVHNLPSGRSPSTRKSHKPISVLKEMIPEHAAAHG